MLHAGEVNYLTQFCQEYEALKVSENWKRIIDLGLKALGNSQITEKNSALIQHKLSSCYYYLGEHNKALKYAKNAYESAVQVDDNGLKTRSLYLSSAIYRMLALKTAGEKRKEYEDCSQVNINAALKLLHDHPDISDVVKAKVYFNDGALKHDLMKNFDAAIARYLQAEELFKKEELCDDDINRTIMRRIRANVESGKIQPDELISEVKALNIDKETKTGVHQSLLLSKLLIECEEICEALICAKEGLEVAKNKSMSTEVRMLNKVIYYIEGGYCTTMNQQQQVSSSTAERESYPVVTQQPQPFLSEAERGLHQAINQQQPTSSSTTQRELYPIVTQQPQSFWTPSEIRQWQEQAMHQQQPILFYEPEWQEQAMPPQQSIFLNQSNLGLYQAGARQSPILLSQSDIEPYQTGALEQLILFTESEIGQGQAVNQGGIHQSIFFTEGQYQVVPQQQPIFFNEPERRQDQVVTQQPPSFLNEPEISITIDRQCYK